MRIRCATFGPIILFAFCRSMAGVVGDFAPLQVGNQWVYDVTIKNTFIAQTTTSKVLRKMEIKSRLVKGDTVLYGLTVWDSSYGGTPTSLDLLIRELPDKSLNKLQANGMPYTGSDAVINAAFSSHTYDSVSVHSDTFESMSLMTYKTHSQSLMGTSSSTTDVTFIKDVGFAYYRYTYGRTSPVSQGETVYSLLKFNATVYGTVTSLVPKPGMTKQMFRAQNYWFSRFGGRDALGRKYYPENKLRISVQP